jgi:hypothetical protein
MNNLESLAPATSCPDFNSSQSKMQDEITDARACSKMPAMTGAKLEFPSQITFSDPFSNADKSAEGIRAAFKNHEDETAEKGARDGMSRRSESHVPGRNDGLCHAWELPENKMGHQYSAKYGEKGVGERYGESFNSKDDKNLDARTKEIWQLPHVEIAGESVQMSNGDTVTVIPHGGFKIVDKMGRDVEKIGGGTQNGCDMPVKYPLSNGATYSTRGGFNHDESISYPNGDRVVFTDGGKLERTTINGVTRKYA